MARSTVTSPLPVSKVRRVRVCPARCSSANREEIQRAAGEPARPGTGSPSTATSRSGNRSGSDSDCQPGQCTAENAPYGSVSRPAKGRPRERRAFRPGEDDQDGERKTDRQQNQPPA